MTYTSTTSGQPITVKQDDKRPGSTMTSDTAPTVTGSGTAVPAGIWFSDRQTSSNATPNSIATNWSAISQANLSDNLQDRLVRLASVPAKTHGVQPLKAQSVQNFLEFWASIEGDAVEPELALAPDGSLHAEWYKSDRQRLDVRFGDQETVFGLFANGSVIEGAEKKMPMVVLLLRSHPAKPLLWSAL